MLGIIIARLFYLGLTSAVLVVGINNWMSGKYILGGGCIALGILKRNAFWKKNKIRYIHMENKPV